MGKKLSIAEIKCAKCEHLNILNLYNKGKGTFGGEFAVLTKTLNDGDAIECYCTSGVLLCLSCQILVPEDNDELSGFFIDIFWQAHTDLRTSLFLVINGHYKAAFQMLRSALENIIVGYYFANCEDFEMDERTNKFKEFRDGKLYFNESIIKGVQKILQRMEILDSKKRSEIRTNYNSLCKYVHPNPMGYSCLTKKHKCVFSVQYDIEQLEKWKVDFQNIILYLLLFYLNSFDIKLKKRRKVIDLLKILNHEKNENCEKIFNLETNLDEFLKFLYDHVMNNKNMDPGI